MSAAVMPAYEWKSIPWKTFQRKVYKLQMRIYRASRRGDARTVHRLQRLLMKSFTAKCLAVRTVTQDNRGKKTAGVDGVKALSPPQRSDLVRTLSLTAKARPTRRVWIPKPGSVEQRPLGIPTMRDRAAETLAVLALEPEWEAVFEPNSYGFRKGRSVHDAMKAIRDAITQKAKYVLDADIAACFTRINHEALLNKLHTFPALRRVIHGWLKAGVLEGTELFPTEEGTPQGGPLSPLLANVALHGLETAISSAFPARLPRSQGREHWRPVVIRYADDFVVLHQDRAVIEQAQQIASHWLASMGLELKPSKTRITHTLHQTVEPAGFDFLGFHVRQYAVGKTHRGKRGRGFKTIIKPSTAKQQQHLADLAEAVQAHPQSPVKTLVATLNPKIVGWANYYSRQNSSEVFSRLDHLLWQKLWPWATRRHPTKSHAWVKERYWPTRGRRRWVFGLRDGTALARHAATTIDEHVKVKGDASFFDGNVVYWASRLGRHPELPKSKAELLKRQQGRCARCGLFFTDRHEVMESDHRRPRSLGGQDGIQNRDLVHRHCHDQKTAADGSNRRRTQGVPVTRAKTSAAEEPGEANVSRPVL
jgi:RNA-directed DNA polymerase